MLTIKILLGIIIFQNFVTFCYCATWYNHSGISERKKYDKLNKQKVEDAIAVLKANGIKVNEDKL